MANIKSAEKKNRQRLRRRAANQYHLGTMRTLVKRARTAVDAIGDAKAAKGVDPKEALAAAIKKIDQTAQRGAIKKQTAARKKSRLQLAFNAATAG